MKKKIFSCLVFCCVALIVLAQSSVFVLIDVSGSGPKNKNARSDAQLISKDLILGKYNPANYQTKWSWSGHQDPIIQDIIA